MKNNFIILSTKYLEIKFAGVGCRQLAGQCNKNNKTSLNMKML